MINQRQSFEDIFRNLGIEPTWAKIVQQYTEQELIRILPEFDGWIVGDDPCTREVLSAGKKGKLKAIVKWGIGVDNVDFKACEDFNIPVENTPEMFGDEVADLAMCYITNLSRKIIDVHNGVRNQEWLKPIGSSLKDKKIGIVGLGNIGMNIVKRVQVAGMIVCGYDPFFKDLTENDIQLLTWPERIEELDYLVLACSLTAESKHLINRKIISKFKKGIKVVNVSRGQLINEKDLYDGIKQGVISGAALDVYEIEPLPKNSILRELDQLIHGTHNGSNTFEAVQRTSHLAINKISNFLNKSKNNS